ncbi:MAG: hypothetical protein KF777_19860 [Planctomycetaceae bacterium]|nr:hypothetical protein [Planctomycetaceae bacterium]
MTFRIGLIAWLGFWTTSLPAAEPRYELLVAGSGSDNIVAFDLTTGVDRVVAKLANDSRPRALATNATGKIVVGLRGNDRNMVELIPRRARRPEGVLVAREVSGPIGRFGPGMLDLNDRDEVLVACDTERVVRRVGLATGETIETIATGRKANAFGLAVSDGSLFVGEYFQKNILRVDLSADPPAARSLVQHSPALDRPCCLTIGHNGHLFAANLENDLVQEFDARTGRFVRTFLDVSSLGARRAHDLLYDDRLERYFLSSGDAVFEIGRDGSLIDKYQSPSLKEAQGLACRIVPTRR